MGSDESNFEGDHPRYSILRKPWRSTTVTLWLRDIDAVHLEMHTAVTGHATRGNWPHPHHNLEGSVSTHPPVKNLPLNFYDHDWLSGLEPEELEEMDIKDRYDLTQTSTIYQ
jgi:hypothetical protein